MSLTHTFSYHNNSLFCEDICVDDIAGRVGTPFYLYSQKSFAQNYKALEGAFGELNPLICYSVKTCGNINILRELIALGAGMDVVSGGELFRALEAGADPKKLVFAGIGKTDREIIDAIEAKVGWFNIESEAEYENISRIAADMGTVVHAALRINPDVYDVRTHEKTKTGHRGSKFGVDIDRAFDFLQARAKDARCKISALHFHLGSPIYSAQPYIQAITKILNLLENLSKTGIDINTINIGGGFASNYSSGLAPDTEEYARSIVPLLRGFVENGGRIIMEPGRVISANSGVLITRVQYIKTGGDKKFAVLDAGMSHLIRPALYDAFQFIWPTKVSSGQVPAEFLTEMNLPRLEKYQVVGPICESSDYLARDRSLPELFRGDLLCIFNTGAYGMVMSSQYNAVPRAPEIMVKGSQVHIIRERENFQDLIELEKKPRVL